MPGTALKDGATGSTGVDLTYWMERYQQADADAPDVLITAVSPGLLRFFRSQGDSREYAEDLLQETWLRVHRVRHTYRPGAPLLPWVYAIARRVHVDHYRRNRRTARHELTLGTLREAAVADTGAESLPDFDVLMAALPAAQREVVTMLKFTGMSVEDVARATSSTVGAVKQKAHRAYQKLRDLLIRETANANKLESD
jgi:RNA polymerase sigma-70 factor (ECF subfamily)